MKVVIFGLSVSSCWGNGHATLWRGLIRALVHSGHNVVFFERDVPYYASHRDYEAPAGMELHLYSHWSEVVSLAKENLRDCDSAIITSYCPDSLMASDLMFGMDLSSRIFYDMDTPVTLGCIERGGWPEYLMPQGLGEFDMVMSYTGGRSLVQLKEVLGAKNVCTLYGSVDPEIHHPVKITANDKADLSYLGTYAKDRHRGFEQLFLKVSQQFPRGRFLVAGAQYPADINWGRNIEFKQHIDVKQHSTFYNSAHFTLNLTRSDMAQCGYCPSARLFEAGACGVALISDIWEGIDHFFEPYSEILLASDTEDMLNFLQMDRAQSQKIAKRARERVMSEHTASHRAKQLEEIIEGTVSNNRRESLCGG
ncbi:glycosyl transferase [Chitinispirillum alkaliphilum]|nr:glycosyl transferase [Chitinispirillum alkaliphilum]